MAKNSSQYIRGFDGLRAISILFVLMTHMGYPVFEKGSFFRKNHFLIDGFTGVMIFFTLSGFLITTLLLEEKSLRGRIDLKKFFIRRFLRLCPPLIVLYTVLTILMLTSQLPSNFRALLFSLLYVYNFVPTRFWVPELSHTWSLAVEEQFYIFWPFILTCASSFYRLLFIPAILIILALFSIYIIPGIMATEHGVSGKLTQLYFPFRWFIPACLPIMMGAITAIILFFRKIEAKAHFTNNSYSVIAALILYVLPCFLPAAISRYVFVIQSAGIAILLAWVTFNQQSILVSVLEFKPLRFIGVISYGIYVYQGLFLTTGCCGKLTVQQFPLNIFLTVLVAFLSWFFIEKPVNKFKQKFRIVT